MRSCVPVCLGCKARAFPVKSSASHDVNKKAKGPSRDGEYWLLSRQKSRMTTQELAEGSALDQTNKQNKYAKHPNTDRKQLGCKYWYNGMKLGRQCYIHDDT
jgi:hypothetical protein